jgi:hypothetical protein
MLNPADGEGEVTMKSIIKTMAILFVSIAAMGQSCAPTTPPPDGGGTGNPPPTSNDLIIEPDDYADETVLTTISTAVTLSIADNENKKSPLFEATANIDDMELAPTGVKVFGHSNIGFFNSDRRLRMDFPAPVSRIQITFGGGTNFKTEVGHLQGYDSNGNLVTEDTTQPLESGKSAVLSISGGNVAFAVAYSENDFGRLDHLVITP